MDILGFGVRANDRAGAEFAASLGRIAAERAAKNREWASAMAGACAAAHPDDGWVDRKNRSVQLVYPYFDRGAEVGSLIALGDHSEHRIVRVVRISVGLLGGKTYHFEE